jgi:hypothetical protein
MLALSIDVDECGSYDVSGFESGGGIPADRILLF